MAEASTYILSTEAATLLSFICQTMPNLKKSIREQSTLSAKKAALMSFDFFTPEQITEAREHPTAYVNQAVSAVASIQESLNLAQQKLDLFESQLESVRYGRGMLIKKESQIAAAKRRGEATTDSGSPSPITFDTTTAAKTSIEELDQDNSNIKKSIKDLQQLIQEIKKQFDEVDKTLQQHAIKWIEHLEAFAKELLVELEANGVSLTTEEKEALRTGLKTISEIREKIKQLKKLGLELDGKTADFIVKSYDAVVAVLSRKLQQIDNKSVKAIIKNLSVLEKEAAEVKQITATQAQKYQEISANTKQLASQINKHEPLTQQKLNDIKDSIKIVTEKKPVIIERISPLPSITLG